MNYTLRHRDTKVVVCGAVATYDELVQAYRELYLNTKFAELGPGTEYAGFESWAEEASNSEIMHEAYLAGYDEFQCNEDSDDDTHPNEYSESEYGEWATEMVSRLAKCNLESYKLNF